MGEMEIEEIEAVLEKIWDLHDKLSDEIHLISRSHFLKSVNRSEKRKKKSQGLNPGEEKRQGYVYIKGFEIDDKDAAIREAKSLYAIRTALEHLEDQLEFLHTIHTQQRTERDLAVARLEQSRILLAMRLSQHHGKSYQVLEEALAFIGSIKSPTRFVSPDGLYNSSPNLTGENSTHCDGNFVISAFASAFRFAKRAFGINHVRSVLGNAAVFAISMVAMIHLHQVATSEHHLQKKEDRNQERKTYRREMSSSDISLDVMMARG